MGRGLRFLYAHTDSASPGDCKSNKESTHEHQFGMPSCEYRKKGNDKQDNRINNILIK